MKKQRDLFEGDEEGRRDILRSLLEEAQARATQLLADLAIKRTGARRKEARDDR